MHNRHLIKRGVAACALFSLSPALLAQGFVEDSKASLTLRN